MTPALPANVIKGLIIQNGSSRNDIMRRCKVSGPLVSMVISGERRNRKIQRAICKIIHLPHEKVWGEGNSRQLKANPPHGDPIMIRNYFQEHEALRQSAIASITNNLEIHGSFKLELFRLTIRGRHIKTIRYTASAPFHQRERSSDVEILFVPTGGMMHLDRFGIEHTHELCLIADCINGIIGNIIGMSIPALDQPDIQNPPSEIPEAARS